MMQVVLDTTLRRLTMTPGRKERTFLERQSGKADEACRRAGKKLKGWWNQQRSMAERGGSVPRRGGRI